MSRWTLVVPSEDVARAPAERIFGLPHPGLAGHVLTYMRTSRTLNRDFRALTGCTPSEYLGRVPASSRGPGSPDAG